MVGLISNTAAMVAQNNLNNASAASSASISRLSSGSAITRSSDNVAGFAVGTTLAATVSTLKAALSNTTQANSLLGVADGALQNISTIIQRQQTLASEAASGSLTNTARGYLNQEFQSLSSQIDQIASSTNFNGINLIDGSLFAPATLTSQTSNVAVATSGSLSFAGTDPMADTDVLKLSIAGTAITLTAADSTAGDFTGNPFQMDVGANAALSGFTVSAGGSTDASNVMQAITNIENSTDNAAVDANGTTVATAKNLLSGYNFTLAPGGSTITITSKSSGTSFNAGGANDFTIDGTGITGYGTAADLTLNGNDATSNATAPGPISLSTGGTAGTGNDTSATAINGYLSAGAFSSAAGVPYGGTATTVATGTVKDSILTALDDSAAATTGVNLANISNNSAFVGTITGFKASYVSAGLVNLSVTVGNDTYTANNVQTAPAAAQQIVLSSAQAGGGSFALNINATATSGQTAVATQSDADDFAARINQAMSGVVVTQNRQVSSYSGVGSIYNSSGTAIGNLTGSALTMYNDNFSNLKVSNVSVTAGEPANNVQPVVTMVINGETYQSGFDQTGAAATSFTIAGSPPTATLAASASGTPVYMALRSETDPSHLIVFQNSDTALDLSTADNAHAFQSALQNALGVNKGGSGLVFQTGATSNDTIGVQIQSAQTKDLYVDNTGATQTLDISTQAGATAASTILTNALQAVTASDANVGALESRFNYAAANLNSSIQNQDAARGDFLDTDVAAESTNFASSQVRLQASISVLAQANQLPQNLLKLLG